jgi:hypothetical protein
LSQKARKSDFVNIVIWFHSRLDSDPYFPQGANPTNNGENHKICCFTGAKIVFSGEHQSGERIQMWHF